MSEPTYNPDNYPPRRPHQCCALPDGEPCQADAEWHILAEGEQPECFVEACHAHLASLLEDKTYTITPIRGWKAPR